MKIALIFVSFALLVTVNIISWGLVCPMLISANSDVALVLGWLSIVGTIVGDGFWIYKLGSQISKLFNI